MDKECVDINRAPGNKVVVELAPEAIEALKAIARRNGRHYTDERPSLRISGGLADPLVLHSELGTDLETLNG